MFRLFAPSRRLAASLLILSLAACHNAPRNNALDPAATPEVELEARPDESSDAVVLTWTRYAGAIPFGQYLVLRQTGVLRAGDTLDVNSNYLSVYQNVPKVDTLAAIADLDQTSFVDTELVANITYTYRVSVVNAGGFEATSRESEPVRGPSAPRIAFTTNRDNNYEIYVMNLDGSGLINLTNHPANDGRAGPGEVGRAVWSPDGRRLAFVSFRDNNWEIYVMNDDGTNPVNITNHPGADKNPSWSPDGNRIAFISERDGDEEIYVMNTDGTDLVNLTNQIKAARPRDKVK
jgi:hypothetical protein